MVCDGDAWPLDVGEEGCKFLISVKEDTENTMRFVDNYIIPEVPVDERPRIYSKSADVEDIFGHLVKSFRVLVKSMAWVEKTV